MGLLDFIGDLGMTAATVAQAKINSKTAQRNTDMTNTANRQLAEYAYSKDLEMWNKGNVYNSPEAQMTRLKEGGLNPNLVYGGGNISGNASSQLPKYNAPTMDYNYTPPVDLPGMISGFQDVQIKNAQIDNLKATNDAIQKQNRIRDIKGNLDDYMWNYGASPKLNILQAKMEQEWNKADIGNETKKYQIDFLKGKNRTQELGFDKVIADTAKANAGTAYTRAQTDWIAGKAIMGLLGSGAGIIGKVFNPRLAKGMAGTLNQANKATSISSPAYRQYGSRNVGVKMRYTR